MRRGGSNYPARPWPASFLLGSPDAPAQEDLETVLVTDPGNEIRRGLDLIQQQTDLHALAGAEAERDWLEAAEWALADDTSTFAVLPMGLVLNQWVYLAKPKQKGYLVEGPR